MAYLVYRFTVQPPQPGSEIVMAHLSEFDFESFDETVSGFNAYVSEDKAQNIDLTGLNFEDFTFSFSIERIAKTNWNAEWEKNFEPIVINSLLCIRASFHAPNTAVKHEIVITPKMSFGTGHHATTRLMCAHMAALDFNTKSVLDMGCGTGILAIYAAKLGATKIIGIDIDEWSVENARENVVENNAAFIRIEKGGGEKLNTSQNYEIVLANINKNILKSQMPLYAAVTKKEARLLLSGFFTTDADELKHCAQENGFEFVSITNEQEWAMMSFLKTS